MRTMNVEYDDGIDWSPAGTPQHRAAARRLLTAFESQVSSAVTGAGRWALAGAAKALHATMGSHFGPEIDGLADAIGARPSDVLLGNLAYDLGNSVGCSTFVVATRKGPLHARNLDWTFPGRSLRDGTTVVNVEGAPAGDYSMVTWPGFFGALTAMAPGRFSVTVNFVSQAGNSPATAVARALAGHWPVPWVVRMALDECRSFQQAVRLLCTTELLSPVLFTVAGTRSGEGVVIERGPGDYAVRKMDRRCVSVTNHYQSRAYEDENVDLSEYDTLERQEALDDDLGGSLPANAAEAYEVLSNDEIVGSTTQHQVVMCAAEPMMSVRLPGGRAARVV